MKPYTQKILFVTNLFKNRIETAIKFGSINDKSIILDIGCESGYMLKKIRNLNHFCKCYGIDNDPSGLGNVENCDLRIADAEKLPFDNKYFDRVFVLDVLEHIGKFDNVINEIYRVLKLNGLVILSGPIESWFYKFCRFLWLHNWSYPDHHLHTIYDIEKRFEPNRFQLIKQKSLPRIPFLPLFRISKFKKIT